MTKISDLPREVIEEIISRVPLASLRAVRSTCKTWNDTSKIQVVGQKTRKSSQFLEFMVADRSVYSLRFDLKGVRNDDYELSGPSITKIKDDISLVDHCDGLLLCILKDDRPCDRNVLSLKGNTYFTGGSFLVCFDFTTERFGRCLPLPYSLDTDSLDQFWVRDEKIAAAVTYYNSRAFQIWITTKIEPNAVSWSNFLRLDMSVTNGLPYDFLDYPRTFFIDEEKKVVVLIDIRMVPGQCQILAHIIGEDGYLKSFNIIKNPGPNPWDLAELVYCSYVPSLVQVQRDYNDDDYQPALSHH